MTLWLPFAHVVLEIFSGHLDLVWFGLVWLGLFAASMDKYQFFILLMLKPHMCYYGYLCHMETARFGAVTLTWFWFVLVIFAIIFEIGFSWEIGFS